MDSRAIFRVDIGFPTGRILFALQSLYTDPCAFWPYRQHSAEPICDIMDLVGDRRNGVHFAHALEKARTSSEFAFGRWLSGGACSLEMKGVEFKALQLLDKKMS